MRFTFRDSLIKLAEKDKDVYLLIGDLGYSVVEPFAEKFPSRFINCGVAEQNMIGLAAGLALEGKKPYVFSIIPFTTLRCLEQIRNDLCYQNLNVKIIGVGSGFSYGNLGATHFAIEDIGVLRVLPNMTVLCPADPIELKELMEKSYDKQGPVYIRLGRGKERTLYNEEPNLEIGIPSVMKQGKDGLIIGTGTVVDCCQKAVEKLKDMGFDFKLISLHTVKPINKEALLEEVRGYSLIFTAEEHNIIGGMGSSLAEILLESGWKGRLKRIGVLDEYTYDIGSMEYLRDKYSLGPDKLAEFILKEIKNGK